MNGPFINNKNNSIAVIGMSGRFPDADNCKELWKKLFAGEELIKSYSEEDLSQQGVEQSILDNPSIVRSAAILDKPYDFDAGFFGYTALEAQYLDPQHRIFMEESWKALEDACYSKEDDQIGIGVYAGVGAPSYYFNVLANADCAIDPDILGLLNEKDYLPLRTSYKLNLRGPSISVQSSCSSSLLAVHQACKGLLLKECNLAIAGGVTVNLPALKYYHYESGNIVSQDGHCRPFDQNASGTIFSSGVGVLVLKRLNDAVVDGDHIYGLIRGSAVNNDGMDKIGFTAPSVKSQAAVISAALNNAGLKKSEKLSFIETHGTGTKLGDPIEFAALSQALSSYSKDSCALGTLKANIGHLGTAAGVAGLIKTLLALRYQQIPANINFEGLNKNINTDNTPFYFNRKTIPWESKGEHRFAGVSSFGIGGTNVHVIVEEAPYSDSPVSRYSTHLIPLSAKTTTALENTSIRIAENLMEYEGVNLADVAYSLQVGRREFAHRRFVLSNDVMKAADKLKINHHSVCPKSKQDVVFMFPGYEELLLDAGKVLFDTEPVFSRCIQDCSEVIYDIINIRLESLLYPDPTDRKKIQKLLLQSQYTQSCTFAIQLALAKLWMSWGIRPRSMIGYDVGEYVAACIAGVFSLDDAAKLVATRGLFIQSTKPGRMLAVSEKMENIIPLVANEISVAAINSPEHCLISGADEAMTEFESVLVKRNILFKSLKVNRGANSVLLDPIIEQFKDVVGKINMCKPHLPFISSLSGTWISDEEVISAEYWASQVRNTFRFSEGLLELLKQNDQIYLEIGAGRGLVDLVYQHTENQLIHSALPSFSIQEGGKHGILQTLGNLWLSGVKVDWSAVYANEKRHRIPLPAYEFDRSEYFVPQLRKLKSVQPDISNLFRYTWIRRNLNTERMQTENCTILLFDDESLLAQDIAQVYREEGLEVHFIKQGKRFSVITSNNDLDNMPNNFELDPESSQDYFKLIEAIRIPNKSKIIIVNLWSYKLRESTDKKWQSYQNALSFISLNMIYIFNSVDHLLRNSKVRFCTITRGASGYSGDYLSLNYSSSAVISKILTQESGGRINCSIIDVISTGNDKINRTGVAQQMLKETIVNVGGSTDYFVALKGCKRWVQQFEAIRDNDGSNNDLVIKDQGIYIIFGGTGKLGTILAEYLSRMKAGRLILVSRSEFPPQAQWDRCMENVVESDNQYTKSAIPFFQTICERGTELEFLVGDVCCEESTKVLVEYVRSTWGRLDGIVHAAGKVDKDFLITANKVTKEKFLSQIESRIKSAHNIYTISQNIDLDFVLFISSLSVALGGIGFIPYASSNSCYDAIANLHDHRNFLPMISLNWDGALNLEDSINALGKIFKTGKTGTLIISESFRQKEALAFDFDMENMPSKQVKHSLIDDEVGEIEKTEVQSNDINTIEKRVTKLWIFFIDKVEIGLDDNFYGMGGDSLLAVKLYSLLCSEFQCKIDYGAYINAETIRTQAQLVSESKLEKDDLLGLVQEVEKLSPEEVQQALNEEGIFYEK